MKKGKLYATCSTYCRLIKSVKWYLRIIFTLITSVILTFCGSILLRIAANVVGNHGTKTMAVVFFAINIAISYPTLKMMKEKLKELIISLEKEEQNQECVQEKHENHEQKASEHEPSFAEVAEMFAEEISHVPEEDLVEEFEQEGV